MATIEEVIYSRLSQSEVGVYSTVVQSLTPESIPDLPFTVFGINNTQFGSHQRGRTANRMATLIVAVYHRRLASLATLRELVIKVLDGWGDTDLNVHECRAEYYETNDVAIENIICYEEQIYFNIVFRVDVEMPSPCNGFASGFASGFCQF